MSGTITARVATSSGHPLPAAVMTVMSATGEQQAVLRGDDGGAITTDALDAGTYTVVITADGFAPTARTAVVNGAGQVSLGTIAVTRSGGAPVPAAGSWEIDPGHSTVEISVRHFGIATIKGRFTDFSGRIEVPEDVEASSVSAQISTASIDTDNQTRDGHLRSAAFFDVEQYPLAEFRATRVCPGSDDTWRLAGHLTLRGTSVPVDLNLSYLGEVDDPWGGRQAAFRATGTLQRNDFGISFDDKLISGVAQIGGTASVDLEIQAIRTP
ncbi:YceI family protein [Gordonia aquimaris]|jgi:polyisoprenoid-binding protein YceI|uniref:YceI family protein n=1 Tax=Gordonia aquimaris TaxID=2984863 RepID=A0A9X3I690_9ACTN|nr:YceI family protein [Gordonia aquimaris]MCX2965820.1 YceI family protein [Gordonia aquimaris]